MAEMLAKTLFIFSIFYWLFVLNTDAIKIPVIARRQQSLIHYILDLSAKNLTSPQILVNRIDENNPVLLDVDAANQAFVYVENLSKLSHDQIHLMHTNRLKNTQFGTETIRRHESLQGDELITSLALDWITKNVYLSIETSNSGQSGRIEVCKIGWWLVGNERRMDGSDCVIIVHRDLDSLHSLVVDPLDGYMYWLSKVHKKIERAWMNGLHLDKHPFHEPISEQQISTTGGLTLEKRLLFYIRRRYDKEQSEIVECALHNRSSCRILIEGIQSGYLAVFQNFLFWNSLDPMNGLHFCKHEECGKKVNKISNSNALEIFRFSDQFSQPNRTNPNPCAYRNGDCSHFCLLIPGVPWRSCACPIGVKLLNNQLTCDPNGIQQILLVGSTDGIFYISLNTDDYLPQRVGYNYSRGVQKIVDVDYDFVDSKIYWIDREAKKIRRCKLDGSEFMDLPISEHEVQNASNLAIDSFGRNLVWLDSVNGRIELSNLISTKWYRKTLLSSSLNQPKALTIDPTNSKIYFSNLLNGQSQIERIGMDGENREVLIRLNGPNWISSLLVDKNQLYWIDREMATLMSINLEDKEAKPKIVSEGLDNPNSIAKSSQTIYYNSLGGRSTNAIQLNQQSLFSRSNPPHEISDSQIYGQMSLRAVELKPKHLISTTCSLANGQCEHICVPLDNKNGHKCLCSQGFELHSNNRNCMKPSNFLVLSSSDSPDDLLRLSTYGSLISSQNSRKMNIPRVGSSPTAIALNPLTQELIFCTESNSQYSSISSARLVKTNFNGTQSRILLEDRALKNLKGLAVDWTTGNIYWSNGQLKRIQLLREDGQGQKTLIWHEIDPRQIVIDPLLDLFFFVDCFGEKEGAKCKIKKCQLSNCSNGEIFLSNLESPPNSLTLDKRTNLLIWSNGQQIWSVDFNGKNVHTYFFQNSMTFEIKGVSAFSGQIYYANETDSTVRRIRQLSQNSNMEILHYNVSNVRTMLIAHSSTSQLHLQKLNSLNECKQKAIKNGCICLSNIKNDQFDCECGDQEEADKQSGKCMLPTKFVLMASRDRFVRFTIRQHSHRFENIYTQDPFQFLPANNVGHPVAMAFDLLSRKLYWIDAFDRDGADVKRAGDKDSNAEYLQLAQATKCSQFHDIVCDVIGRQLFVSCSRNRNEPNAFVHVWRIGSNDRLYHLGFVVDGDQRSATTQTYPSPRRIAVFNQLKALFYVDENPSLDSPLIIRCTLEGRHCSPIVSHGLHFHRTRLASDLITHRLLYTSEDGIWSRDIFVETDIRHPLLIEPYSSRLIQRNGTGLSVLEAQFGYIHIGSLAPIDDKSILFTATNQSRYDDLLFQVANNSTVTRVGELRPLQWANEEAIRRRSELLVVGTLSSIGQMSMDLENFGCLNSNCSHLCVALTHNQLNPMAKNFECLCSLGFSRSIEDQSKCQQNIKCQSWQFACEDGFECIHSALKCDRISDCNDESDESPLRCNLAQQKPKNEIDLGMRQWICDDRRMSIPRYLLCNGSPECTDSSDETHCRCKDPSIYFDCNSWDHIRRPIPDNSSSHCILRSLLCDGKAHCANVADELPQVCKHHSDQRQKPWSDNQWMSLLFIIGALFILFLLSICCCACFAYRRSQQKGRYRRCRRTSDQSAELSLHFHRFRPSTTQTIVVSSAHQENSLYPEHYFTHPANQLANFPTTTPYSEEFPLYESATLPHKRPLPHAYNSLPWTSPNRIGVNPNYQTAPWPPLTGYQFAPQNQENVHGAGEFLASSSNVATSSFMLPAPSQIQARRFHVPPPSAASISTYGIAKPAGIRYPISTFQRPNQTTSTTSSSSDDSQKQRSKRPKRRRKRQRNYQSPPLPPPAYSEEI